MKRALTKRTKELMAAPSAVPRGGDCSTLQNTSQHGRWVPNHDCSAAAELHCVVYSSLSVSVRGFGPSPM